MRPVVGGLGRGGKTGTCSTSLVSSLMIESTSIRIKCACSSWVRLKEFHRRFYDGSYKLPHRRSSECLEVPEICFASAQIFSTGVNLA